MEALLLNFLCAEQHFLPQQNQANVVAKQWVTAGLPAIIFLFLKFDNAAVTRQAPVPSPARLATRTLAPHLIQDLAPGRALRPS